MNPKRQRNNKGSAIIEMTLLISILLGIIYLYISLFVFMIETGKEMNGMVECMYSLDNSQTNAGVSNNSNGSISQQGNIICARVNQISGMFLMDLELRRYSDSAVKNIRRWKLAIDTVHTGENE